MFVAGDELQNYIALIRSVAECKMTFHMRKCPNKATGWDKCDQALKCAAVRL